MLPSKRKRYAGVGYQASNESASMIPPISHLSPSASPATPERKPLTVDAFLRELPRKPLNQKPIKQPIKRKSFSKTLATRIDPRSRIMRRSSFSDSTTATTTPEYVSLLELRMPPAKKSRFQSDANLGLAGQGPMKPLPFVPMHEAQASYARVKQSRKLYKKSSAHHRAVASKDFHDPLPLVFSSVEVGGNEQPSMPEAPSKPLMTYFQSFMDNARSISQIQNRAHTPRPKRVFETIRTSPIILVPASPTPPINTEEIEHHVPSPSAAPSPIQQSFTPHSSTQVEDDSKVLEVHPRCDFFSGF